MQKDMAQCFSCRKHVHKACDSEADISLILTRQKGDSTYEYMCTPCRANGGGPKIQGLSIYRDENSSGGLTPDSGNTMLSDQDSMDTTEDSAVVVSTSSSSSTTTVKHTSFSGLSASQTRCV